MKSLDEKIDKLISEDFSSLCLCEYRSSRLWVNVWAAMHNGRLTISGQDLGDVAEERFSDSDYEYWYAFDEKNTKLLIAKLLEQSPEFDDVKELLTDNFSSTDGCSKLRDFCEKFEIQYNFSSYS